MQAALNHFIIMQLNQFIIIAVANPYFCNIYIIWLQLYFASDLFCITMYPVNIVRQ